MEYNKTRAAIVLQVVTLDMTLAESVDRIINGMNRGRKTARDAGLELLMGGLGRLHRRSENIGFRRQDGLF